MSKSWLRRLPSVYGVKTKLYFSWLQGHEQICTCNLFSEIHAAVLFSITGKYSYSKFEWIKLIPSNVQVHLPLFYNILFSLGASL